MLLSVYYVNTIFARENPNESFGTKPFDVPFRLSTETIIVSIVVRVVVEGVGESKLEAFHSKVILFSFMNKVN